MHVRAVAWVHIPKAGQSFLVTLALYGWEGVDVIRLSLEMERMSRGKESHAAATASRKFGMISTVRCPRLVQPFRTGHQGVLLSPWRPASKSVSTSVSQ